MIMSWFEHNWSEDGLSMYEKKMEPNSPEVEQIITKLLDPPKKGHDHCGPAITVFQHAPTIVHMLLVANSRGTIENEKVKLALTTLRDTSRVGFMVAFTALLRLSVNGDSKISEKAKLYISLYCQPKFKSKCSQVTFLLTQIYFSKC